ncbi:MAG: ABC transporter permease subunit [Gammaproteobacteria bacterium]
MEKFQTSRFGRQLLASFHEVVSVGKALYRRMLSYQQAGARVSASDSDLLAPVSLSRQIKERLGAIVCAICGIGIIGSLLLMCLYLTWEASQLAWPAQVQQTDHWTETSESTTSAIESRHIWLNGRGQKAFEISNSGSRVFGLLGGGDLSHPDIPTPDIPNNSSSPRKVFAHDNGYSGILDNQGHLRLFDTVFKLSWPEGTTNYHQAQIEPELQYPLGDLQVDTGLSGSVSHLDFQLQDRRLLLAYSMEPLEPYSAEGVVKSEVGGQVWSLRQSLFGGSPKLHQQLHFQLDYQHQLAKVLFDHQGLLYLMSRSGELEVRSLTKPEAPLEGPPVPLLEAGAQLTDAAFILGESSLVVGDSLGQLALWRRERSEDKSWKLHRIRDYEPLNSAITLIVPEQGRKGFIALAASGEAKIYYIGSSGAQTQFHLPEGYAPQGAWLDKTDRHLLVQMVSAADSEDPVVSWASWSIDNEFPEAGAGLLWLPTWYEGYGQPEVLWQSSAATLDFEPKFSLLTLLIGTLKGAFYAMLFSVPIALLAAIYVAFFMAPVARSVAKPAIEMLAAMPTVILGFLAALWLSPIIADHLSGVLLSIVMLPLSLVAFAQAWSWLPVQLRRWVPTGWEFLLALPVGGIAAVLSWNLTPYIDAAFFAGDFILWLDESLNIVYEQRNAFIVGIAMSFAVIPIIFSISEDALYEVPDNLIQGGLALGATVWQTVIQIAVPTASPGIFSAIMIGLGRSVGETMVVIMATGNTPITSWLPFNGMRTLSANIAVEMPEAEVGSTHFHLLFLSAIILFVMTFIANSLAEYVRHRLRSRYATL